MSKAVRFKYPSRRQILRLTQARLRGFFSNPLSKGNVLVLHTGRSGSTLLGNMLDQHPDVFWDGEVVERYFHKLALVRHTSVEAQFGARDLAQGIAHIQKRMKRLAAGCIYGLELQLYQLEMLDTNLSSFVQALEPLGFDRFIFMQRKNHLRKIASHMVATVSQKHHVPAGTSAELVRVKIDPSRCFVGHRFRNLVERIEAYDHFYSDAEKLLEDSRSLSLDYDEDFKTDPHRGYLRACGFLGLPERNPAINLSRTADFPLSELIENYDEIADLLANTRHAWMAPPDALA